MLKAKVHPRLATSSDSDAIARIYSEGIADRVATFETEPRTAADIAAWRSHRNRLQPAKEAKSGALKISKIASEPIEARFKPSHLLSRRNPSNEAMR